MSLLLIMVLWTWGLTPLWVNIVGTVIAGFPLIFSVIGYIVDIIETERVDREE